MDWFVAEKLAIAAGTPGVVRYVLKDALVLLPNYGWSFALHGCIYIAKDLVRDQRAIPAALAALPALGDVHWIAIFPEGTRFDATTGTAAERSRLLALEHGLPDMTHVLLPRTRVREECGGCPGPVGKFHTYSLRVCAGVCAGA